MVRSPSEGSAWRQLREQRFRARCIALAPRQSSKEAHRKCFPGHQRVRLLSRRASLDNRSFQCLKHGQVPVGVPEALIHLQHATHLPDSLRVLASSMETAGEVATAEKVQRIVESTRSSSSSMAARIPANRGEVLAIQPADAGRDRLSVHRRSKSSRRFRPIVVVGHGHQAQERVRVRKRWVDLERPERSGARLRHRVVRRHQAIGRERKEMLGQSAAGRRKLRIEGHRPLEAFPAPCQRFRGQLRPMMTSLEEGFIRGQVRRVRPRRQRRASLWSAPAMAVAISSWMVKTSVSSRS